MRYKPVAFVVACLVAVVSHGAEPQRNAADLYREAFKQMDALPADLTAALHEEDDDGFRALSDNQKKLVESSTEIWRLLGEAQLEERCEWDEPFFDNPMSSKPPRWLGSTRRVSHLACLRERYHREVGRSASKGVDDVIRAWTMGRRISRGSTLINGLVQISIDALFLEHLAATLPSLTGVEVELLLRRMNALPKADTLRASAQREIKAVVRWFREDFSKDVEKHVAEWEAMKRQLHAFYSVLNEEDEKFDPLPYRAVGVIAKTDPKRFQAMVDEFEKAYEGQLKIYDAPLDRIDATFDEWKKSINKDNQLIKEITVDDLGVFKHLPRTEHRVVVLHAMFRAGAAYLEEGEAALAKHKEPISGKTFELVKHEGGFTLRSPHYKDADDKPWSLRFGRPAK